MYLEMAGKNQLHFQPQFHFHVRPFEKPERHFTILLVTKAMALAFIDIANFLKYTLPKLSRMPDEVARREIRIFVDDLKKHHAEEEKVTFPLALRADRLHKKRTEKLKARS